ncbi:Sulfite exporter TauE/SafE family protein [Rhynchospora pubera]|uniref:Sulfite exporter TauE/SafE family protein n=2 Tax=Magnoliopsida TaxID=3398 RepID=A0AAV8C171_9POAL|nr:Sulfite exporter TauE/SafE family protein [Rhynchospora pubera]
MEYFMGLRAPALGAGAGRNYTDFNYVSNLVTLLFQTNGNSYEHVWPDMEFGWRIVLGSLIGFFGAAFGSVGGVGGGGIYVPMLTLIVGFDAKSSTAISKCMIMGAAASTVYYNLKLRHPTLDMPIIDYDLALLIQPMLMLGISLGVIFNVIFPDWLVTVLLIVLFIGTSTKAFLKGVETWNKETILLKESAKRAESKVDDVEYRALPSEPGESASNNAKELLDPEVPILENVCWKEFGLLMFVWLAFLVLQVTKNYTSTCSTWYWVLNLLQIPVSLGVSGYEAVSLYQGRRTISSKAEGTNWKVNQLVLYCMMGVVAGIVGGLLGLGGGFIMGPLFLELGIPPQVSSATATFAMTFSSSMSVVEYYLLKRFPIPYAVYFIAVATVAAWAGQHVVRKLIHHMGRASLIIFILAFTIFVSAISLDSMANVPGAADLKDIKDMIATLLKRQDAQDKRQEAQDQNIAAIQAHLAKLDSRIILPEDNSESTMGSKGPDCVGTIVPPRFHRIEFPLFDGSSEPLEWLCRCEQYFRGQRVLEDEKVWLAAYHMTGVAQQWYYKIELSEGIPNWTRFKEACQLRFGPPFRSNPITELSLLQQSGSVEGYTKDFYRVLCRTEQLAPAHEIGLFLSGLSEIIRSDVEMQNPISLEIAVSLARASERHYQILWGSGLLPRPPEQLLAVQPVRATSLLPKPPEVLTLPAPPMSGPDQRSLRRLTPTEMAERRQKGLCFNCDELYTRGHKCKRLFWLEIMDEDEQGESSLLTANETPNKYG